MFTSVHICVATMAIAMNVRPTFMQNVAVAALLFSSTAANPSCDCGNSWFAARCIHLCNVYNVRFTCLQHTCQTVGCLFNFLKGGKPSRARASSPTKRHGRMVETVRHAGFSSKSPFSAPTVRSKLRRRFVMSRHRPSVRICAMLSERALTRVRKCEHSA